MPQPSIALVGPGAIGSTVAAAVREAGHPVLTGRRSGVCRRDDVEALARLPDGAPGGGAPPWMTPSSTTLFGSSLKRRLIHGIPTPISDVLVPLLAAASDGPG